MTVTIPVELQQFVREKIAAGEYADESHVITLALQHLKTTDDLFCDNDALRKQIAIGLDEADRGLSKPWNPAEIKAEGRRLLAESQKKQFKR